MAVFLINICKFNNCGLIFKTLSDLVLHIEENHIDYDSTIVLDQKEQQQPTCLPLSYVLRFYAEPNSQNSDNHNKPTAIVPVTIPSSTTTTPKTETEVEIKDGFVSDFEDSNESWTTTQGGFSSDFILRYGTKTANNVNLSINQEKPFGCPVPGCKKRYKNINGIKYHSKNGHKNEGRVKKAYKCHCGKSYKTYSGLKGHSATAHDRATMTQMTSQNGDPLQVPVKALTLKSIASLGLPLKTLIIRQDSLTKSFTSTLSSAPPSSASPPSSLPASSPPLLSPSSLSSSSSSWKDE
ncbi:juxtaposed with another zinc finger protein 1 isoform X2 [Nilaparvata lugens]|uniref:juxtaposed with another zinc finger protein 1 isoform X2 n=1 Tax=Nilaparvata lugens TaxID=108931 RepID=UPI00193D5CD2|nr:juxtaposed with another zinc finger protein 1 isoform X2 [Nilaparvata lugens]